MRMILASLLVVSVIGCSSKNKEQPAPAPVPVDKGSAVPAADVPPPTTGSAAAPPAAGSAAVATPTAPATASTARPNHALFSELGAKAPSFPQLKSDGKLVIASFMESDAKGKTTSWVAVLGPDGKPGKPIDAAKKGSADEVLAIINAGTFTPFEAMTDLEAAPLPVKHGDVAFDVKDSDTGITLLLTDSKGAKLQEQAIKISDKCSANPRPDYVWFDTARKRVLVEVGWELGPHDCNDAPDPLFVFWPMP